ncbi:ABC transporter permease [Consotaella aegiceratis]|uniref:ABC transporter permease n=1 Tax=Consotaella aegiceratis TaxID=3097961 RepID=UPI002F42D2E3
MLRYLARKLLTYLLTFIFAVTIDWAIPRFMPGNPIDALVSRIAVKPEASQALTSFYMEAFNLDAPWWEQYLSFWGALLHGDLGRSIMLFPTPVATLIGRAMPYTLGLLLPAILLSWYAGNHVGALAARRKILDNTVLPTGYALTATPYMWLGILLAWLFGSVWSIFPLAFGYDPSLRVGWTWEFVGSVIIHWVLPFASLFIVAFGGWAIGMRNMIIYELESDYANYLEALGAPQRLVRKYAFRNAMLPQITGLALQLGAVVGGALVTEIVFSYPGLGWLVLSAIQNEDYFLIQGIFLFIIVGVLLANLIVDIVYVIVDPRTRIGLQGEA